MRIGVISDIHSNLPALQACIRHLEAEGCDVYFFLGDYVSDTPYTRETMDFLYGFFRTHACRVLRGNREEYMLSQRTALKNGVQEQIWLYNSASGNLRYAYEQLTGEDLDFFESLPITFDCEEEGYPGIRCCHGSPKNARELVRLDGDRVKYWLDKTPYRYLICAHTHCPGEFEYRGKHCFNPGCVGIAINDPGFAQCLMLEDVVVNGEICWKPSFLKIPYDNKKVVRDMVEGGLLEKGAWFINGNIRILLTGKDCSAQMVGMACRLSEQAGETTAWPLIDEKYFEQAARALGIPDWREH